MELTKDEKIMIVERRISEITNSGGGVPDGKRVSIHKLAEYLLELTEKLK